MYTLYIIVNSENRCLESGHKTCVFGFKPLNKDFLFAWEELVKYIIYHKSSFLSGELQGTS